MKLAFTKTFIRDYRRLPSELQEAVDKQLELLLSNPRHPSLNSKKMNDPRQIWEARVTASYRFTWQIQGDVYIPCGVGDGGGSSGRCAPPSEGGRETAQPCRLCQFHGDAAEKYRAGLHVRSAFPRARLFACSVKGSPSRAQRGVTGERIRIISMRKATKNELGGIGNDARKAVIDLFHHILTK